MKVLVVDDHDELRRLTVQFLELLGHSPLSARDGAEAARLADTAGPIDVALVDLQLGAKSGLSLADELERVRPGLRILFMSGYGREDCAPDRPNRHFIEKPFTIWGLESALSALMAARGASSA